MNSKLKDYKYIKELKLGFGLAVVFNLVMYPVMFVLLDTFYYSSFKFVFKIFEVLGWVFYIGSSFVNALEPLTSIVLHGYSIVFVHIIANIIVHGLILSGVLIAIKKLKKKN